MVLQLPSEVVEHIVAEIPRKELGPLLFVSKTLYHHAIRFLFRDIAFESYDGATTARLLGLFDILSTNHLVVESIQRVHIRLRTTPFPIKGERARDPEVRAFARILELLSGSPLKELDLWGRFSPLGLVDDALSALLCLRRLPTLKKLTLEGIDNVPYSLIAGDPATDQLPSLFIDTCSLHVDKRLPPPPLSADGRSWKHVVTKTMAFPGGAESANPRPAPLSMLKTLTVPDVRSLFIPLATWGMSSLLSELLLDSDSDSDGEERSYITFPNPFVHFPSLRAAHLGYPIDSQYDRLPAAEKRMLDVLRSMPDLDTLTLSNISITDDEADSRPISLSALPHTLKRLRNLSLHVKFFLGPYTLASFATTLETSPVLPHVENLSFIFDCCWQTSPFLENNRADAEPVLGPQHDAWKICTDALTSGRFPSLRVFQVQVRPALSTINSASELRAAHMTLSEYLDSNWRPELVMGSLEPVLKRLLGKDIEVVCCVVFDTEKVFRRW